MGDSRKQKLIVLGAETLAEALLDIAVHSDAVDDLVEHLISTPKENVQRFKKKFASLKRLRRFVDWRSSSVFSRELEMLLQDLKAGVTDPLTGVELVAKFYETDEKAFWDIVMIPVARWVMCFALMPKSCLWNMPPATQIRKRLQILF